MSTDVVIVGAGVIGCAIADALAAAGAGRILVVDRGQPGGEASNAAAGLLSVASSRAPGGALFDLQRASVLLFPELARALRDRTAIDVEYREAGLLDLAFTDTEARALTKLVARRTAQGFAAEIVGARAALDLEPGLSASVQSAALFPGDRSINPVRMVEALYASARGRGVEFRFGAPVTAIDSAGSKVRAIAAGGERVPLGRLVIAAGVWSRDVGAMLRVPVPVRPDKGEMAALRAATSIRYNLSWNEGYLVPRNDGEIVVGSTSERGSFDKSVSASALALLLRRAAHMVPGLAGATLARTWAGLRPCSTIRRPVIGPVPGYENVVLATGHHRAGIMLAPITAQLVTELMVQGATTISLEPFSYRRR